MKRGLRWLGIGLGAVVGIIAVLVLVLYLVGSSKIARPYEVETAALNIADDSASLARGAHLARINGCTDCHGANLEGKVFADEPPFRVVASNLTRGRGGVGGQYDARLFDRAIRHGVGADGESLLIMPAAAFHNLSDEDAADLIGYLLQAPPVDNELPPTQVRTLGRILSSFALDPTFEVRLESARASAPAPSSDAEYGEYLTSITCAYCHGADLRGAQPPNPSSPPAPDLAAAGRWMPEQFITTLRTGVTPGNRELDPEMMPWTFTRNMTDEEILAIHNHLASLTAAGATTASASMGKGGN